jgi:hypothetical protein
MCVAHDASRSYRFTRCIIEQVFGAIEGGLASGGVPGTTHAVTLSFCQLYLDTVQDLLSPT